MCLGGGGGSKEARRARQEAAAREAKRQANITAGKQKIDDVFSQYNDDYYGNLTNAYVENYTPQLEDQFSDAKGKMLAALAAKGMQGSSIGNSRMADILERYNDENVAIGNRAADATSAFKQSVSDQKSQLYNMNLAATDPETIAAQATAVGKTLVAPSNYDPLGDVFADILAPLTASISGQINNPQQATKKKAGSAYQSNSGRIVM